MIKRNKVLITGGAGFIGSNLVEELLKKNYEITVLDNFSTGHLSNISEFKNKITIIKGDIRDYSLVEKHLIDKNIVFHLAAMVSVPESVKFPKECEDININATKNILNICLKNDIKFIFASSAAVYGEDRTEIKTEDLPTIPISPYGWSKLKVEKLSEEYSKKGLKYVCYRNFNVYGPKQDFNHPYSAVIPSFISKALNNQDLNIFGEGYQTRDFIYVKDIVGAMIVGAEEKICGVFNLGCNDIINLRDLATLIIKKTGSNSKIIYKPGREGDIMHSRASSDKIFNTIKWRSKYSFNDGLNYSLNYYTKTNIQKISKDISLILPVSGKVDFLELHNKIKALLTLEYKNIVIVNDNVLKKSEFEKLELEFGNKIKIISHSIELGEDSTIKSGILFIQRRYNFKYLVLYDYKNYSVNDVINLIYVLETNQDKISIGVRFFKNSTEINKNKIRDFGFSTYLTRFLLNVKLSDVYAKLIVFDNEAFKKINLVDVEQDFYYELFSQISNQNISFCEVPVLIDKTLTYSQRVGRILNLSKQLIKYKFKTLI